MKLSIVIITENEEKNIGPCLESVKWADEIIVVDAMSSDKTAEIAKKYTDKVFAKKWTNFFDQRSYSLGLAQCDFVLILDTDEVLDRQAQVELKNVLSGGEIFDGYNIMRDTYFLGKRLSFAEKRSPVLRLFRRENGFVSKRFGQRGHEGYDVHGSVGLLGGIIEHYTSHTIAERLKKINRYSTLWAAERAEHGIEAPPPSAMVVVAIKSFIGNYFIRGGFRDGFPGFLWCSLKAFENFLKIAKLYENIA